MSNKDEFNRIAALVLETLDEHFPVAVTLTAEGIIDEEDQEAVMVFYYTVQFLSSENLLRFESDIDQATIFTEMTLTGKGLALLNSVPEFLQEKPEVIPFRQKITGALKAGSKETLRMVMNQLIESVVKGQWHLPGITS
jgi:hypothetical protein